MATARQKPVTDYSVAISASFTAEPLGESLDFWMQELEIAAGIEFAPLGQVFQQLLDPESLLSINRAGVNVILLRLQDWIGEKGGNAGREGPTSAGTGSLEKTVREFIPALKAAAGRSSVPFIVCLCPEPPLVESNTVPDPVQTASDKLATGIAGIEGAYLVTARDIDASYPVADYYDLQQDELASIPYSRAYYAALGSTIARHIYSFSRPLSKVIVLDCDQTLWQGVCGEDGPHGIEIDFPHHALQEFMVRQHDAGMLVCLCSKNNEEDVLQVFRQRTDMPLKLEHIVAHTINWKPKSENIRSLSEKLGLGLDSFVFLDDDPVECAEVRSRCPRVLTLRLPRQAALIPRFINNIWALDHLKVTGEARVRTASYRQNIRREEVRETSVTLEEFLDDLELDVSIEKMVPANTSRVIELVQRTNQFNATTIRHSGQALRALCDSQDSGVYTVTVSDRFGDYGLVGVIGFRAEPDAIVVDTFLVSCRALGRRIEHRMLASLAGVAGEFGVDTVSVYYIPGERNQLAGDFLESVAAGYRDDSDNGYIYRIPAELAATC